MLNYSTITKKKSLSFSITFADDCDVTDEIADDEMIKVNAVLSSDFGAIRR